MSTFQASLVSPETLVFSGEVDQVDLQGTEGDFGVLAGHAPIVATLRPGIVTVTADGARLKFVVLGGLAEFSKDRLMVLADSARALEDFDLADFATRIEDMENSLAGMAPDDELDRAVATLDHYRSIHQALNSLATTAF